MRKVCSPYKKIFKFFFFLIHAEGFISCEVNRTMITEVLLLGLASLRLLSLGGGSLGLSLLGSLLLLLSGGSGGSFILLFVSREHPCFFWACLSSLLLRASLTLDLRASAWSANILDLAFSAFFLWICSMRTRLFLKVLPLAFRYSS